MTDVNNENVETSGEAQAASSASGLPLRGLAMVLIAVAVLFGLWALYSFTQGGDDNASGTASDTTQGQTEGAAPGNGSATAPVDAESQADGPVEDPANPEDPNAPAGANGAENPDAANDPAAEGAEGAEGAAGAAAGAPAAQAGGASASPEDVTVNVVNNSTITGLAEETYNLLRDQGYNVGEHGNLPEQDLDNPLPETTVFYEEGDAAGQQAAEQLAQELADTYRVPTTTAPNIEQLPEGTAQPGHVTLALIGELMPTQ